MAPSRPTRRILLGNQSGILNQKRTYRTADYLEIDHIEFYDVRRRRIFYDEILLVTRHTAVGWMAFALASTSAAAVGLTCLALMSSQRRLSALFFFLGCVPLLALAVLRLTIPVEVVTVFGKRTWTHMRFWIRRTRASDAYALICRLARERQVKAVQPVGDEPGAAGTAPETPSA